MIQNTAVKIFHLPVPTTPLVGRQVERAEILKLLEEPRCCLVTLVGPGGIGKTRLALGVARQLARERSHLFEDGISFVALAAVQSPEELVTALASGLSLSFHGEQGDDRTPEAQKLQLLDFLRDKNLLLVLDNFEQLMLGAELLGEILQGARLLKVLVTSRERLNLPQEWIYEVSGMGYPSTNSLVVLEQYSAIELFVQAARRSRADYTLTDAEKACVINICRLLYGLPLAIEMAAAWTRMFSCAEIAQRIENNLDFLTSPLKGVPERHRSLRGVFEHSWLLLSRPEQITLSAISVFIGEFRLEVAEYIIAGALDLARRSAPGEFTYVPEPLLLVSALVDKSLVRRVTAKTRLYKTVDRFEMHELIRQYAVEKLQDDPGLAQLVIQRYSNYYLHLLDGLFNDIRGERQLDAMDLIGSDIVAIRSAWQSAFSGSYLPVSRRAVETLFQFYNVHSLYNEGEEDFIRAASGIEQWMRAEQIPAADCPGMLAVHALSLFGAGFFCSGRGDINRAAQLYAQSLEILPLLKEIDRTTLLMYLEFDYTQPQASTAAAQFDQSLAVLRAAGDRWGVAALLLSHGLYCQSYLPDLGKAASLIQESLSIFRELGDRWGMEVCYNNLALQMYGQGEYEQVKLLTLEGLALSQALADRWQVAEGLLNLGQADTALGNYARAKDDYQTSLSIMRELGSRRSIATHLACLGYVQYLLGEYQDAEVSFKEALWLTEEINDRREVGMEYINLGNVARAQQKIAEARNLYQDALSIMDAINEHWGKSVALKRLGSLSFAVGEISQAWDYYLRALAISLDIERKPEILEILVGIAEIMILESRYSSAYEILSQCMAQREMTEDVRRFSNQLLEQLKSEMSPQMASEQQPFSSTKTIQEIALGVLKDA